VKPSLTIACAICTLVLARSAMAQPTPGKPVDLLVLWDTAVAPTGQDPLDLGAFLGTLREGDRVGVLGFGQSAEATMPLRRIAAAESRSLAYEVLGAIGRGAEASDLTLGLEKALELLAETGDEAALKAVVLVTRAEDEPASPDGGSLDAGADPIPEKLLAQYLLEEVILHAVIRGAGQDRRIQTAVANAGGRCLALPDDSSLAQALSFVYESLQLASIEMARKKVDDRGAEDADYSFLDETKSIDEIEQSMKDESTARARQRLGAATSPLSTALLIVLLALSVVILALLVFLAYRLIASGRAEQRRSPTDEQSTPSFAKLTLGLNRFTRLYDEAGEKLRALSLDLEDFGATSWEVEKRMMDSYASVTDSLFLLIDHLEVQARGDRSSAENEWFLMRLRQLLEDENISEIRIATGDELDPKLCSRAGDREDAAPPGTVLEVVRKGYVRKKGPTGSDLVLRQAEVIVSRGIGGGKGEAEPEEE
jgi:molecular chaperone GrpE (heat shock protein)